MASAVRSSRSHDGDNAYLRIKYKHSKLTATNCIRFIECLPVPSGALAGHSKLLKLLPWQKELIRGIYPEVGKPRNEVLLSIARRNGKSVTLAAIMCFLLFNRHKRSAPVQGGLFVSAASNKDQAAIIFDILKLWCSTVIDLDQRCRVNNYHRFIDITDIPGVRYKAIPASAVGALGGQYSAVICDEVGFWKSNELQLALRSGMASTPPEKRLFLQASTVPNIPEHFFFDELKYFADKQETENHYALVKITDPRNDKPDDETTWIKANPSYGVLVNKESFQSEYQAAKMFPQRLQGFISYRCNAPIAPLTDNTARFISRDVWDRCHGESKLIAGEQVVCAFDCSSTQDLTCLIVMSLESPHRIECHFIVPQGAVAKNKDIPYRLWAEQGYCKIADKPYISKQSIVDLYRDVQQKYFLIASQSDLFGYPEIAQLCDQQGIDLTKHTARNTRHTDYNDGLHKLAELIRSKKLIHDNPLLTYCIDNLRIKESRAGATIVDRELSTKRGNKIDGAISLLLSCLLVAGTSPAVTEIDFSRMVIR